MHRGLLLKVIDGTIYVTPLCQVVVHHASSPTAQSLRLEREKQTKVFDYTNSFRPALESFALTHTAPPDPHAIFSLGQSWGPGRHVARNFVSIVVTHLQAKDELDSIALPHTLNQDSLLSFTPKIVEIEPNDNDREAEAFLQQLRYRAINWTSFVGINFIIANHISSFPGSWFHALQGFIYIYTIYILYVYLCTKALGKSQTCHK